MSAPGSAADRASDACEVRFGQVGLANVRVLEAAPEAIRAELARRVESAPDLFSRTAVILDLNHLPELPDAARLQALLDAVRAAGMLPVGLAYGDPRLQALSTAAELPLIARFRDAYERAGAAQRPPAPPPAAPAEAPAAAAPAWQPALLHDAQVRGGQQLWAEGRDLVVTAPVADGAELIADGSVHVYGALHGRAIAGARGDTGARIFCTEFHAQLVSIAGQYRVFEELPEPYAGQAVQCWLENDKLHIALLRG